MLLVFFFCRFRPASISTLLAGESILNFYLIDLNIVEFCCLKQLKTANSNSPWAYITEGLFSEGYLRLRFGGLIFGKAFFFLGGGGMDVIGILRYNGVYFAV